LGAKLINGTVHKLEIPANSQDPYTLHYADHSNGTLQGDAKTLQVDMVIGADGANSRVARAIDAGDYNYAIAFQERIRLPEDKMAYYEDLAEMYVGDDVSPDFYAWVFPKYDHVAVGTGTMRPNQARIKELQAGIRARAANRLEGGEIIKWKPTPFLSIPDRGGWSVGWPWWAMPPGPSPSRRGKGFTLRPSPVACVPRPLWNFPTVVSEP
jgi:geranylgeranyl reductase